MPSIIPPVIVSSVPDLANSLAMSAGRIVFSVPNMPLSVSCVSMMALRTPVTIELCAPNNPLPTSLATDTAVLFWTGTSLADCAATLAFAASSSGSPAFALDFR